MKWSEHTGAIITGIAAVAAAFVAAWWASQSTSDVVKAEGDRSAARVELDARGAARVLSLELLEAGWELSDLAQDGYFRRLGSGFVVDVPKDDLRLIASEVSGNQWADVTRALSAITGMARYMQQRAVARGRLPTPLTHNALTLIARDMSSIRAAIEAVAGVGELTDTTSPSLDIEAAWARLTRALKRVGLPIPKE